MDIEQKPDLLPIVIEGHTFSPNAEGLWSLNEMHQTLGLTESKRPSEWSNSISEELLASGNFRKVDKVGSLADELGAIAYSMWVSTAFYLMVAKAFVAMRNDAILSSRMASIALVEADRLLADNLPKANALTHRAKCYGISWSEACRAAGIQRPKLAKSYLVSIRKFTMMRGVVTLASPRPKDQGFTLGFFKRDESVFGGHDGWKVTDKGLVWLQGMAQEINEAIRQRAVKKAKGAREKRRAQRVASVTPRLPEISVRHT